MWYPILHALKDGSDFYNTLNYLNTELSPRSTIKLYHFISFKTFKLQVYCHIVFDFITSVEP